MQFADKVQCLRAPPDPCSPAHRARAASLRSDRRRACSTLEDHLRLRVHELRLLDDKDLAAPHYTAAVSALSQLGTDNVNRKINALALAGLVVIADQFLGDHAVIRMVSRGENAAAFALSTRVHI